MIQRLKLIQLLESKLSESFKAMLYRCLLEGCLAHVTFHSNCMFNITPSALRRISRHMAKKQIYFLPNKSSLLTFKSD